MAFSKPGASSVVAIVLLVGSALAALTLGGPPAAVPATAPAIAFSAERAMGHVTAIAQRPHPVGSVDHERVRAYVQSTLEGMGLAVDRQPSTGVRLGYGGATAASVENVIIRLKGSASTGAVLMAAHYDSVAAGPGAADAGSAVASLLEALRASQSLPTLRNDVIALFTDGEELGLLGAEAFVREHRWAKDVRVALNFEARGTTGPVVMFETGAANGGVVGEWASSVPRPSGSSLTYEVYKHLPNDTDFTVFRRLGVAGLNFAFVGNWRAYHTPLDAPANLDPRTLQHSGSAALAMIQRLGSLDLASIKSPDAVYFSIPVASVVIRYPVSWVLPLAFAAVAAFVWVTVRIWRRRNTSGGGLVLGLIVSLVLLGIAGAWSYYFSRIIEWMHGRWIGAGNLVMSEPYGAALVLSIVAAGLFFYALLRRRFAAQTLALVGLFFCLVATVAASWLLPGGSYVLLWPLLGGLVAAAQLPPWGLRRIEIGAFRTMSLCALGLPSALIMWPLLSFLIQALGMTPEGGAAVGILTALTLFTLVPQMEALVDGTRLWPSGVAVVAALLSAGYGASTARYSAAQPRSLNVVYALDAQTRDAYWVTRSPQGHPWLRQLLGDAPASGRPAVLIQPWSSREGVPGYVHARADAIESASPIATPLPGWETGTGGRTVVLRVAPAADGHALSLWFSGPTVLEMKVNGRDVGLGARSDMRRENQWTLEYGNAPAAGITISVTLKTRERLSLAVLERVAGWPEIPGKKLLQRPADVMPIDAGDQTVIRRNFVF